MFANNDFKIYRNKLGFSTQKNTKQFLKASDIKPTIDYEYIELLNLRLCEIIKKINLLVHKTIQPISIEIFCENKIQNTFKELKNNNIIMRLNNQGRRPEQVYFSWMRGYVICEYFKKSLANIFSIEESSVKTIGGDDLSNINSFKRSPTADLEIKTTSNKLKIEVQSGFSGINDIKLHKVREAKSVFNDNKVPSIAIHFDLFNGQVAFVNLHNIKDNDINWITRQQMEGQTVFNIDQNNFVWKLTDAPPSFIDLQKRILNEEH